MPSPDNPYRPRKKRSRMVDITTNIPKMPKPKKKSVVAPMAKQYAARARRASQKIRAGY